MPDPDQAAPVSPGRESVILNRWIVATCLALAASNCSLQEPARSETNAESGELDRKSLLEALASDSLLGRRAGTEGARTAARVVARQLELAGLEAAGDSGYFQSIPLRIAARSGGRGRVSALGSWAAFDSLADSEREIETNVVGIVRGSDPDLAGEFVLVTAHFDHLGIGRPIDGDSIYNGADDDASGVVALVEIAREVHVDPPKRSVVIAAMAGEESGMLGTRWYVRHPVVPLAETVAALNLEMVGRPDTALGSGKAWLTGFERSSVGPALVAAGIPVFPDPRPGQRYFERGDNFALARVGIPAHTLSSFGLHRDYHTPDDEVERIDFLHLHAVTALAIEAVRLLADGPAPVWNEGQRP